MSASPDRRQFLGTASAVGLAGLPFLANLRPVSAADTRLDPNLVRLSPDVEPLVRLIEDTPRNKLLEEIGGRVKQGLSYQELLAGLPATLVALGFLWLGTVPLTSGLVAQIFGPAYMSMLYGFVFLSHQVGSFLGAWLGGRVFDLTGSYDPIWWAAVALGIFAAVMHAPIGDKPLARAPAPAAT